jgi:mRNA-degrading endonuclease RelE of RelBE toxin-antitoxin system
MIAQQIGQLINSRLGFWRLRVRYWRAICHLRAGELILLVIKIAPRGDAYK